MTPKAKASRFTGIGTHTDNTSTLKISVTAAPERVRVNCDLRHVNVVLCCDPKAFTHLNPLDGLVEGGAFIWESSETAAQAWSRIPQKYRQEIIDKKIRVFTLPGFDIANVPGSCRG